MIKLDSTIIFFNDYDSLFCHSLLFLFQKMSDYFFIYNGIYLLIYGNKTRALDGVFKILE